MSAANKAACFKHTGAAEGGFSNRDRKDDPGGPTKFGVTAAKLGEWRRLGREATAAEVEAMPQSEAVEIYDHDFWRPVDGDHLPAGVDLAVFDYGLNSGPGQAVRDLQRVVGAAVDGVPGSQTLAAVEAAGAAAVINGLCDRRLAFMRRLKNWSANRNGWTRRVADIRKAALAMAAGDKPKAPLVRPAEATAKAPPTQVAVTKTTAGQATLVATAAGGAAVVKEAASAASDVHEVVSPASTAVAKHAADQGLVGHIATLVLLLIALYAAAAIAYRVWRSREEAAGRHHPSSLLGFALGLCGYVPAGG